MDLSMFTFTAAEAEQVDPNQRLVLEVVREAFENAGETERTSALMFVCSQRIGKSCNTKTPTSTTRIECWVASTSLFLIVSHMSMISRDLGMLEECTGSHTLLEKVSKERVV